MIKYTFSVTAANHQYLDIKLELDNLTAETTYLYLPAWRPGRYQIANFAKYIQQFLPCDENGTPLPYQKVNTHCWAIHTEKAKKLVVQYNYFANVLDAGNTYIDDDQLYLNPINCALYDANRPYEACEVNLLVPDNYAVATALPETGKHTYEAKDFHHLADSPIIASDFLKYAVLDFQGYRFHLWFLGIANPDYERIKADFERFIRKAIEQFGEFPVKTYHFFYQLPPYELSHGVEHQESTVIALGPGYKLMSPDWYKKFLAISCHELYHTWNIKMIRPAEMTPYNYQEPNYSRLGFMAEGVTSYFGDLILLRSGVFSFDAYRKQFNNFLVKHFHNYGRFQRSLAESSFDSWLDGYEAGAPARKTSIYIKGMLVAFMLDVELMRATANAVNLDTVMARLYYDYAKVGQGYSEEGLKGIIENEAGCAFDHFFEQHIYGTKPLETPLADSLDYLGLRLIHNQASHVFEKQFGFKAEDAGTHPSVIQVAPDSPAYSAGLSLKDELVALNGLKINHNLDELIAYYEGQTVELTIFRNGKLKLLQLMPGEETFFHELYLGQLENPSPKQTNNFQVWSHQPFPEQLNRSKSKPDP